jgi:diguanylate cyclase (GGDEF)-like protein
MVELIAQVTESSQGSSAPKSPDGRSLGHVELNEQHESADASRMNQANFGPLVQQWRNACALDESEGEQCWAEEESALLLESVLAASQRCSTAEPEGSGQGAPLSAVERATRSWARTQSSLPLLTMRVNRIREVLTTEVVDDAETPVLDNVCGLVMATATEEFTVRLQRAALTDPLTQAGNRRALDNAWRAAAAQGQRLGQAVCLVAIDLDGLKRINDFQGHAAGDEAIVSLCAALRAALRDTDDVFRIGGDEFVALLPGTAAVTASELMVRVSQYHAPRFSWGAADTFQDGSTLDAVLGCADRRLYGQRRRNRPATTSATVVVPTPQPSPWSRMSAKRAVELAVSGVLALAIGAVVVSISGGNHSLCSGGEGPTVVNCGLSNAVYFAGIVLMTAGGIVLGVGIVVRALRGGAE